MNPHSIRSPLAHKGPIDTAVLLIGHGTRDDEGLREFFDLAALVAEQLPDREVAASFLEFAEPAIGVAVSRLAARGFKRIIFMPVLLFAAGHAKRDIPRALEDATASFPQIEFSLAQPLGCHVQLLRRSAEIWSEVWTTAEWRQSSAHWILVGRGSLDSEATAETVRYASILSRDIDQPRFHVAFLSMAEPRMEAVLDQVLAETRGPVVAIPHLLFQGDLLREFHKRVSDCRQRHPGADVRAARHLGPSPLVAAAVAEMVVG